ncbi:hypothetical protein RvY_03003-2 [Ramazzottius varieornatus]|uniref:PH domain-containing protein n=1 Tax=Ramazzottius varieornatus TaxID=947166 RepID=A0A1D1UWS8_RAMVA|nr:hypothetical protein RvY_03003-2 [Ramazzottius varieornatus]
MVQKGHSSPVVARHLQPDQQSPRHRRAREMSVVSDLDSVKSVPLSVSTITSDPSSDVTIESGYETITDVVSKGTLWYYKPRWFGESWRMYDAVLTTNGVFSWYKRGSDPAELEGSLALKSIPNGLITIGSSTQNIPKEQQVRFPKDFTFSSAIAIGEPYNSGEIFWFLAPSPDMTGIWQQGFREVVQSEKFSTGASVFSAWKKYSPERPSQTQTEPAKEGWNGVEAAVVLALDFAISGPDVSCAL